jgi:membrane protease subunit HflK
MGRLLLGMLLAVLVLWTVGTSLTQIQPGERGVVRRFGRVLDHKPGQGLHVGLPWGIDVVDRVPVGRVRRVSVGVPSGEKEEEDANSVPAGQMLTGDHNLVNVQAEVYYQVNEEEVANFVLQADRVDALVARMSEAALAEWIGGRTVDEVLLRGKIALPAFVRSQVQRRLLPYRLGIEIEQASVTKLYPPDEVKEAFDRLAQAQSSIRTQVYRAEQDANRRLQETQAEVVKLKRGASAYANEERVKSKAEASSFLQRLEQYRKIARDNPDALNAMWLDEMTRIFTRMRETGRVELLDHYLTSEGLNITQFPLLPRKK